MPTEYYNVTGRVGMAEIIELAKAESRRVFKNAQPIPQKYLVQALLGCAEPLRPDQWESSYLTSDVPMFPRESVSRTIQSSMKFLAASQIEREQEIANEIGKQRDPGPLGVDLSELAVVAGANPANRVWVYDQIFKAGFLPVGFVERGGAWWPQWVDSQEIRGFCKNLQSKLAERRVAASKGIPVPELAAK